MASNNFLIFDENVVNMMSQEDYETSLSRQSGVGAGIADSTLENKKAYQASLAAYALGELIKSRGYDADDTSPITLVNNLIESVTDIASPEIGDYIYTARTINDPKWIKCQGQTLSGKDYPELASLFATSAPAMSVGDWVRLDSNNPSWWDDEKNSWGNKWFVNCSTNGNITIQYTYNNSNLIGEIWGYGYSSAASTPLSPSQYYTTGSNTGSYRSSAVMYKNGLRGICYYTSGSSSIADKKGIFSGSISNLVYEPASMYSTNTVIDLVHDGFYGFLTMGNTSLGRSRYFYFNTYSGSSSRSNWGLIDFSNSVRAYDFPMIANGQILSPGLSSSTDLYIYKLSSDGSHTSETIDAKVTNPTQAYYDGKSYILKGSNGTSYSNSNYLTAASTFTKITDSTLATAFGNAKAHLYEAGYHIAINSSNIAYLTKDFNSYVTVNLTIPSAGSVESPNFKGLQDTAGRQNSNNIISDNGTNGIYVSNITVDASAFTLPTLGQDGVNVYIRAL